MYKITIENKVIETAESLSVDEIVKNNFSNIRPVAAKIDGVLVDLSEIVTKDSLIELIKPADEEGLEIIRHTCAHVLAMQSNRYILIQKWLLDQQLIMGFIMISIAKTASLKKTYLPLKL